jgi:lysozyme
MQYSSAGLALTKSFEGCKLSAYQDSKGVWTIGFGHTSGVQPGDTCTQEQADVWLMQDIQWAVTVVNSHVTAPLTQGQFDALCDFVYNCGSGNFEHSTLLGLLNSEDYQGAANEFCKWDHAGGVVVPGLLRRRQAEEVEFNS